MYGLLSKLLMGSPQTLQGPGSGVLQQLLSQGVPMGGGTGQGDFPPPPDPASQMPTAGQPASPGGFSDFLSPEVALPMAGALMAGPTFGAGMGQALAGAGPALAGLRDKNRSKAYLSQNFPELAAMSDAGAPMDVLWKAALHKRGIGGDTTFSTPTLMTKPDGTQAYVMFGNDGSMKPLDSNGLKPGKVTYRDAGTYTSVLDSAGNEIGQVPKDVYGAAQQRASGKVAGETGATLPTAINGAQQTVSEIDQLMASPGLSSIIGSADQYRPSWTLDAAGKDALARYNQLKGRSFLQAYGMLRGGGAITEVEGNKAQDAMARMDRAQDEDSFKQALSDFRDAVASGLQKLQQQGGETPNPSLIPPAPAPAGATKTINGKTYMQDANGDWYEQ